MLSWLVALMLCSNYSLYPHYCTRFFTLGPLLPHRSLFSFCSLYVCSSIGHPPSSVVRCRFGNA